MGKGTVAIKVQNWADVERLATGETTRPPRVVETEALVDTGATGLYLKCTLVRQLGLRFLGEKSALTMSNRKETRRIFAPVDLEIQGRNIQYQVTELPDELPNIIGQIPLEGLDWVVDPVGQRLIGNPAHGGGLLHEEF
jgi:predicted aspartyl protease